MAPPLKAGFTKAVAILNAIKFNEVLELVVENEGRSKVLFEGLQEGEIYTTFIRDATKETSNWRWKSENAASKLPLKSGVFDILLVSDSHFVLVESHQSIGGSDVRLPVRLQELAKVRISDSDGVGLQNSIMSLTKYGPIDSKKVPIGSEATLKVIPGLETVLKQRKHRDGSTEIEPYSLVDIRAGEVLDLLLQIDDDGKKHLVRN